MHSGKAFLLKVVLLKPLVQYHQSLLMIACLSHCNRSEKNRELQSTDLPEEENYQTQDGFKLLATLVQRLSCFGQAQALENSARAY